MANIIIMITYPEKKDHNFINWTELMKQTTVFRFKTLNYEMVPMYITLSNC